MSKTNYKILSRLLGFGAVVLILFRRRVVAVQERNMLMYLIFAMAFAWMILAVLFAVKPGLFKDRPSQPE